MRFMMIVKSDPVSEQQTPKAEDFEMMGKYNQTLRDAGVLLTLDGLSSSKDGAKVTFNNGKPTVKDGPFTEAKELVAGFSIMEADSLAEVIELVKQWPQSDGHGNVQVEIRPILTAKDLGFSPEQLERYARLEAEQSQQQ